MMWKSYIWDITNILWFHFCFLKSYFHYYLNKFESYENTNLQKFIFSNNNMCLRSHIFFYLIMSGAQTSAQSGKELAYIRPADVSRIAVIRGVVFENLILLFCPNMAFHILHPLLYIPVLLPALNNCSSRQDVLNGCPINF